MLQYRIWMYKNGLHAAFSVIVMGAARGDVSLEKLFAQRYMSASLNKEFIICDFINVQNIVRSHVYGKPLGCQVVKSNLVAL